MPATVAMATSESSMRTTRATWIDGDATASTAESPDCDADDGHRPQGREDDVDVGRHRSNCACNSLP